MTKLLNFFLIAFFVLNAPNLFSVEIIKVKKKKFLLERDEAKSLKKGDILEIIYDGEKIGSVLITKLSKSRMIAKLHEGRFQPGASLVKNTPEPELAPQTKTYFALKSEEIWRGMSTYGSPFVWGGIEVPFAEKAYFEVSAYVKANGLKVGYRGESAGGHVYYDYYPENTNANTLHLDLYFNLGSFTTTLSYIPVFYGNGSATYYLHGASSSKISEKIDLNYGLGYHSISNEDKVGFKSYLHSSLALSHAIPYGSISLDWHVNDRKDSTNTTLDPLRTNIVIFFSF